MAIANAQSDGAAEFDRRAAALVTFVWRGGQSNRMEAAMLALLNNLEYREVAPAVSDPEELAALISIIDELHHSEAQREVVVHFVDGA